ncbi:MAG: hypothetical protein ACLRZ2_02280 [Veillonella sp.]
MFADEIIVLKEGRVYAQGRTERHFTEAMMEDVYRVKTKFISMTMGYLMLFH